MKIPICHNKPAFFSGFSLVEVAIALGLVTFAMVAIMGLLPVGLQSVKNAGEHAGAAMVVSSLADRLRTASATNASNPREYSSAFAGQTIAYETGGTTGSEVRWSGLTLEGGETTGRQPARLCAVLQILEPPSDTANPGRAVISVAWSAQSDPQWSNGEWHKAEGDFTVSLQFLPGQ